MRKLLATLLATALVVLMATGAMALDVPAYKGRVTDLAGLISPGAEQTLNTRLAELERSDSTQITVLTIPSLEGDSMADFGIRVADAWKVGQKGTDNGAILIVSKADRKIRIEVGYGLEGVLTDLLSSQIIANVIGPRFKTGDFDGGFLDGVTAMTGAVRGEYTAAPQKRSRGRRGVLPLIVIPMIIFIAFTEMFGKRRRRTHLADGQAVNDQTANGQGRHGSGLGTAASTLFFLSMLGGGRGGGGGFGDGGGGFGGFGGGGFGGGGAGGDW